MSNTRLHCINITNYSRLVLCFEKQTRRIRDITHNSNSLFTFSGHYPITPSCSQLFISFINYSVTMQNWTRFDFICKANANRTQASILQWISRYLNLVQFDPVQQKHSKTCACLQHNNKKKNAVKYKVTQDLSPLHNNIRETSLTFIS